MKTTNWDNLTFIDLLTSVAVVGILISLVLPALAYMREGSRRNVCGNNMGRYVAALHVYHDVHGAFPAATGIVYNKKQRRTHGNFGTTFHLLPYMHETARYRNVVESESSPPIDGRIASLQGPLPFLLCPSDSNAAKPGLERNIARCNIMTSRGDVGFHNNAGLLDIACFDDPFFVTAGIRRSVFHPVWGTNAQEIMPTWKSKDEITDGLGNTIAISEAVSLPSRESRNIRGAVAIFSMIHARQLLISPGDCLSSVVDTDHPTLLSTAFSLSPVFRANIFSDGRVSRSGFSTILPPNSPSCNNRPKGARSAAAGWGIYSACSLHLGGGVNVAFFDGSLRFVSETIDTGNLNATQPLSKEEPSPYGVWGALGTPASSDSVANP